MVLRVTDISNNRTKDYQLNSQEDFSKVFSDYPHAYSVCLYSKDFVEAAENLAEYLSNHNCDAYVLDKDRIIRPETFWSQAGTNDPSKSRVSTKYHTARAGTKDEFIDRRDQGMAPMFDDPWDQAKHDRGGDEELAEYLRQRGFGLAKKVDEKKIQEAAGIQQAVVNKIKKPEYNSMDHHPVDAQYDINRGEKYHLKDLFRAYKNSPHHPLSLGLKYMVHLINNKDKYSDTDQNHNMELDTNFLNFHKQGRAKSKNGHITVPDLRAFTHDNKHLIKDLIVHKEALHDHIRKNFKDQISTDENGNESVVLSRGLNSSTHDKDHALASYTDSKSTAAGFGSNIYTYNIPLKNIWYSFDHGFEQSTGQHGPENEWLVDSEHPRDVSDRDPPSIGPRRMYERRINPNNRDHMAYLLNNNKLSKEHLDKVDLKKLTAEQIYNGKVKTLDSLFSHKQTPGDFAFKHATDQNSDPIVRDSAITNKNLTPEHIQKLNELYRENPSYFRSHSFARLADPETINEMIDEGGGHDHETMYKLLRNPNFTLDHIDQMAKNPKIAVKETIYNQFGNHYMGDKVNQYLSQPGKVEELVDSASGSPAYILYSNLARRMDEYSPKNAPELISKLIKKIPRDESVYGSRLSSIAENMFRNLPMNRAFKVSHLTDLYDTMSKRYDEDEVKQPMATDYKRAREKLKEQLFYELNTLATGKYDPKHRAEAKAVIAKYFPESQQEERLAASEDDFSTKIKIWLASRKKHIPAPDASHQNRQEDLGYRIEDPEKTKEQTLIDKIKRMVKKTELSKEMYSMCASSPKLAPVHGVISPDGEFYKLDPKDKHLDFIVNKLGIQYNKKTDDTSKIMDQAWEKGWVTLAHAGTETFGINPDKVTPQALSKFKALIKDNRHILPDRINIIHGYENYEVDTDKLLKYGIKASKIPDGF